jgi:hypothetical protein
MSKNHIEYVVHVFARYKGMTLKRKKFIVTTPVDPSLQNARDASAALTAEIATYIADSATAISNALNGNGQTGIAYTDVQALADQMTADAATLQAGDPLNPVVPTPPPVAPVTDPTQGTLPVPAKDANPAGN